MKKFAINVNGKAYEVEVEEIGGASSNVAPAQTAAPVQAAAPVQTAAPAPVSGEGTKIEAPMPGTILKINVNVGDTVTEGQAVVVLEAMKMENDIPATVNGQVVSIHVNQGDSVNSGDVLVVIA